MSKLSKVFKCVIFYKYKNFISSFLAARAKVTQRSTGSVAWLRPERVRRRLIAVTIKILSLISEGCYFQGRRVSFWNFTVYPVTTAGIFLLKKYGWFSKLSCNWPRLFILTHAEFPSYCGRNWFLSSQKTFSFGSWRKQVCFVCQKYKPR